jgi:AcrR family transcriptional regulator
MPRPTFFNLPEAKRQAIIDLAIEEFAEHDYRGASISRLVERAGIAKGSIYQYFEDKRDLFLYLIDLAGKEKVAILEQVPAPPGLDFFAHIRWLASVGVRAELAHPRLAKVAYRAYYGDLPFHDEVVARVKEASLRYFEGLVRQAIAAGEIDSTIDPDLAVLVISTLGAELGNFILKKMGVDPAAMGREGKVVLDQAAVEQVFDDFTRILEFGMGTSSRPGAPVLADGKEARR